MNNKIPNYKPVNNETLSKKFGCNEVDTRIYNVLAKTFQGIITKEKVTAENTFLEHGVVVQGINQELKLKTVKVETGLLNLSKGLNPLINIRRNPTTDVRVITPTPNFFWTK
jgi:hypothetical protein